MPEPVNPYIAGNPVTGEEMFFGRESVFAFVRQALTGQHQDNVIVLYGQRRTGKTSALYQMQRHLDARYICIFVDLHGLALDGVDGFLWELAHTIYRALRRDFQIDLPRVQRAEFVADARGTFKDEFLPQIWSAIGDRHILLMLDEAIRLEEQIHAGKLSKDIFEYLRHLMQHYERLNFLFALGSGLEEMEREYAFLFSVGLYKKISFLTRDAATALITRPVKDYYQIEPSAIDRIFNLTSGHPYFTQLLCHSLFNHWQQQHQPLLHADDVNAVLDEVVERGLAVLKQVWEDSTPGEKAVLAGLSAAMGKRNHLVGLNEIDRVWAPLNVTLPDSEKAKAIRSLIARDVISGEDKYQFSVDLQRLWVQKYERLEWVKEEIAENIQQWQPAPKALTEQQRAKRAKTDRLAMAIILGIFVALIFFLIQGIRSLNESVDRERASRLTLEARVTRIAEAIVTATAAATAPASTATAGAAALIEQQRTATVLAVQCAVPATAADDLLARVNALRAQNGAAPLQLDAQLAALAQRHSDDVAAGGAGVSDPNGIAYQACQLNDAWTFFANDTATRTTLLNPQYTQVGIGITSGPLSTFILKFSLPSPTDTPQPTPTSSPLARPTATPSPARALDFDWTIESQGPDPTNAGQWQIIVDILARGGDGNYQYFHDGLPVDGPRIRIVNRACRTKPGSFWVQDGTGQIVRKDYYFQSPYCLYPTPTP